MARLAQAVAGQRDAKAFAVLFDHFAPRVNAYLRRLGLEPNEAEEITKEVMFTLWHKAGLFDPAKASLATWIFRIARNRRIDAARRRQAGRVDEQDPALQPEPEPLPGDEVDVVRREARIRLAVSKLPEGQIEMIRRAFFLGHSHSRIAEESGLPLGTVKSRIRLAFARLRALLEEDAGVDRD